MDVTRSNEGDVETFGRDLATFFDDVITCKDGYRFSGESDIGIRNLFRRKSGPIYSIVELTIETTE